MPERKPTYPADSFYQTEVDWKININHDNSAVHSIDIKIHNPTHRELSHILQIGFQNSGAFGTFITHVDDHQLPLGIGFNVQTKQYILGLSEVEQYIRDKEKENALINITFKQQDGISKLPGDDLLFTLQISNMRLESSVNNVTVNLPELRTWKRFVTRFYRLSQRNIDLYSIKDVDIPPTPKPKLIDESKGLVKYSITDGTVNLVFAFQGYPGHSVFNWVTPIILSIPALIFWIIKIWAAYVH